jgi:hypothetical protein
MGMDFNRTPSQAYDDRPAQGRGTYVADGDSLEQQGRASIARLSIQNAAAPSTAGKSGLSERIYPHEQHRDNEPCELAGVLPTERNAIDQCWLMSDSCRMQVLHHLIFLLIFPHQNRYQVLSTRKQKCLSIC